MGLSQNNDLLNKKSERFRKLNDRNNSAEIQSRRSYFKPLR
jgi:hypothetical protein